MATHMFFDYNNMHIYICIYTGGHVTTHVPNLQWTRTLQRPTIMIYYWIVFFLVLSDSR